jgi:hypothetical protein
MFCAVSTRAAAGAAINACAAAIKHTSRRAIDCIIILCGKMQSEGKRHKNRWVFTSTTLALLQPPGHGAYAILLLNQLLSLRYADQT